MEKTTQESNNKNRKVNISNRYFDIDPPVFIFSALLVIFFIVVTLVVGEPMERIFESIQDEISKVGGWFFVLVVNLFLVFCLALAFSRYGSIRLGGRGAEPDFSKSAWFAMLFSAGMGIGILFWSVGEPVLHYVSPPTGEGGTVESAEKSMQYTFLHWGLHAWGIYALVAMGLAFFSFNKKLPLTISSVFQPMIGERIHGGLGKSINVLAVIATLFGISTSLGLGVQQINAGLNHIAGIPVSITVQIILLAVITLIATASVIAGMSAGVKRLSQMNIFIGALFLAFIIIIGPSLFILGSFVQNTGAYLNNFFEISFWTEAYTHAGWQRDWTVFYWAWWISWSPFVGMFIARISRGRTIREFVMGVLLVPSLITFLWLSSFGGSALYLEINSAADLVSAVEENVAVSLFVLLEQLPLDYIASVTGVLLITSFFVTSSDSGSLVVDSLTSGGKLDAPVYQRVFWAITKGAVAGVLLVGGGLGALQTASIITGLPFALVLLVMTNSLLKGLRDEKNKMMHFERQKEEEADKSSYAQSIQDIVDKRDKMEQEGKENVNK